MTQIITVTALREHFDFYLDLVAQGQVFVVTRYSKPVGMLQAYSGVEIEEDWRSEGVRKFSLRATRAASSY